MKEELAFKACAFPCNSRPFLRRIEELLEEAGTNSMMQLKGNQSVRACMWILMAQLYGEGATIDLAAEWADLNKTVK